EEEEEREEEEIGEASGEWLNVYTGGGRPLLRPLLPVEATAHDTDRTVLYDSGTVVATASEGTWSTGVGLSETGFGGAYDIHGGAAREQHQELLDEQDEQSQGD
ncbi:hypothetical protein Vretimale_13893, partial [Volvox reticuliferus]